MTAKKKGPCKLCKCSDHNDMPKDLRGTFDCPLVGKVCPTCCKYDFASGMAARDTAKLVYKISRKTPQEAHETCRTCPHGGKHVGEPGKCVYVKPGHKKEVEEMHKRDMAKLAWLRGEGKKP